MPEIEVRPARPEDKEAVLAFCEHTWEDGDYIADVWDEWLADPRGRLLVALIDGRPVAIERAVMLSDREAWWEGLRVDPDYRGQGLVGAMRPYLRAYIRAAGATVSRMATASDNTIVHGMAWRGHMQRVGRYVLHEADPLDEPLEQLQPLAPKEVDTIRRFLAGSDIFQSVHGLFVSRDWVWQELSDTLLATRAGQERVWGLAGDGELAGLAVLSTYDDPAEDLWIGYTDGTPEGLPRLLAELRRLAHHQGRPLAGGHFPVLPRVFAALEQAGYRRAIEVEMWIYEVPMTAMRS